MAFRLPIISRDHSAAGLHILADFASAAYTFDVFSDACDGYGGSPVGKSLWTVAGGNGVK